MIAIEITEGRRGVEIAAEDWRQLVGDSFTAAFSQPEWYLSWLEAFPPKRLAVVTARDQGRLVGLLPLGQIRNDARGLYLSQLAPFARGDYQSPIVVPERAAEVLPAMLDAAFQHFGRSGVFWWPHIPETDPSLPVLRAYFRERGMPFTEDTEEAPRLRLDGRDFATVEKSWKSSHRIDVRRQRKRLAQEGEVTLWVPTSYEEAEPVLTEFFRVHDEKWLSQGFPGKFQDPRQQVLFRAMVRNMIGKGVHFSTVRCGETHISYGFALFSGGWIQWYRPTYRSEYHNFSPTKIHIGMLVEEGCKQGWAGIDFLLGAESYKTAWTNEAMNVIGIQAGFSEWSPSYFWFSTGKPYVREKLAASYFRAKAKLQQMKQPAAAANPKPEQEG